MAETIGPVRKSETPARTQHLGSHIYTSTIRENSITVFNRAESKNFPPVRFLADFFFLVYNYTMTTKNDKEMSIKVDLRDKYDRKALTFINGFHRYGLISIKKSFVDRRRKYSSTVTGPLKPKYTRPFKKARAKAEFNDFFALESNETKLSGRSWTTYTHDISSQGVHVGWHWRSRRRR